MSDLEPRTVSALDQFSGICHQIADITVAHHTCLVDGKIPLDLASTLTSELHDALVTLFVLPPPSHDTANSDED